MSTLFSQTYGLTEIQIGLTFLANGFGCIIGSLTTGRFLDFEYRRFQRRYEDRPADFPLEQARLRTVWLWGGVEAASLLVFGWSLRYHVHMSVPIIATFFLGWAATSVISVVTTYMVDVFPKQSASATAALNLVRCLMAAGGTAAVLPVVGAIGSGWTFTVAMGLILASFGLVVIQMRVGPNRRRLREEKEKQSMDR